MKVDLDDKLLPIFFARAKVVQQPFEKYLQDLHQQLAKNIKELKNFTISIEHKIALSQWIIKQAYQLFDHKKICLAWTGGKDSTLILWLTLQVVKKEGYSLPHIMFINEGQVFPEIQAFVKTWGKKWRLKISEVKNSDVLKQVKKIGDTVVVSRLDKRNQQEVRRLGYKKVSFPFEPESYVGNHLMKTVAMNRYLEKSGFAAVITGIRWDEQKARSTETYFSKRGDKFTPTHTRIHPILHFSEKEVWQATLKYKIPFCELYKQGYRSLGAKGTTHKADNKPAWEQDFQRIPERSGRRQDKEGLMENLRKLGYM